MELKFPTIDAALIKIVGVFTPTPHCADNFLRDGYIPMPLSENLCTTPDEIQRDKENTTRFFHDKYYREFRRMMFMDDGKEHPQVRSFVRNQSFELKFKKWNGTKKLLEDRRATCTRQEIYVFNKEVAVFALRLEPHELTWTEISDLIACFRMFNCEANDMLFHNWISANILHGIPLRGDIDNPVFSDLFSGSKFKVYSVISTGKSLEHDYDRDSLLFEIGTSSRLGTIAANDINSPAQSYYNEIMKSKVEAFRNYTGLGLLDSFTVIGEGIWCENSGPKEYHSYSGYMRTYFAIYVYALFVKYSVFKSNIEFLDDPIKERDRFDDFVNRFNFYQVSFDFLPNLFYGAMRRALQVDDEINHFQSRLQNVAASLQEDQERRQAFLLTVISLLSSISAIEPIYDYLEGVRNDVHFGKGAFYTIVLAIGISFSVPLLRYLFPHHSKRLIKWWKAHFS